MPRTWNTGGGDVRTDWNVDPIDLVALQELYEDPNFVQSLDLDAIGAVLVDGSGST